MKTQIKMCGLCRPEDITYANDCMPEYIGFVFAKSQRQVSKAEAQKLKSMLNPSIQAIGVFVNSPGKDILELTNKGVIDIIQLHGDESPEYIRQLKEHTNAPVIKAFRVSKAEDLDKVHDYPADYYLFDTASAEAYGGTGESFAWDILKAYKETTPFFLAGGIGSHNLAQALLEVQPFGVDLSSSIETLGVKDYDKMKEIMKIREDVEDERQI